MNAYVQYGTPRSVTEAVNALHRALEAAYGSEFEFAVTRGGRMVACEHLSALSAGGGLLDTRGMSRVA